MPGTATSLASLGSPVGIGLGVVGALGSLIGGGNSAATQAGEGYLKTAGNDYTSVADIGSTQAQTGQKLNSQFNGFLPTVSNTVSTYLASLGKSPYTSTYDTSMLNQAQGDASGAFARAKANLIADASARGVATPGGQSAAVTGGVAGIDSAQAASQAQIQNQIAMQAIQQHLVNQGIAANVAQEYAQNMFAQSQQALNGGAGNTATAAQGNLAIGDQYLNLGVQQQQANSAPWQSLSNLGGLIYGMSSGGGH